MDPYQKDAFRTLIQVRWPHGGWLVWNWDETCWDLFPSRLRLTATHANYCNPRNHSR